jgi:ubiquinone/menaquinone biosynthesis C-methylase UbiE
MNREEMLDLPFDQYQRYNITQEIIQVIKADQGGKIKVLDVGGCADRRDGMGHFLPISFFLPEDDIAVVDVVDFKDPVYVKGDGSTLNFSENSFDVVVCNDVLEHILPSNRKKFIENLIRVSKAFVILSTPHKTKVNELAEHHLLHFIQKRLGAVHEQLKEHIHLGLPGKEEVEEILKESGVVFFSFPSGNIYRWFLMMVLKHYIMGFSDNDQLHRKIDRFYNLNFWKEVGSPEPYRYFFVILKGVPDPPRMIENMEKRIYRSDWKRFEEPQLGDEERFFRSILDMVWMFHKRTSWVGQIREIKKMIFKKLDLHF